jgi:hypothetical protein
MSSKGFGDFGTFPLVVWSTRWNYGESMISAFYAHRTVRDPQMMEVASKYMCRLESNSLMMLSSTIKAVEQVHDLQSVVCP